MTEASGQADCPRPLTSLQHSPLQDPLLAPLWPSVYTCHVSWAPGFRSWNSAGRVVPGPLLDSASSVASTPAQRSLPPGSPPKPPQHTHTHTNVGRCICFLARSLCTPNSPALGTEPQVCDRLSHSAPRSAPGPSRHSRNVCVHVELQLFPPPPRPAFPSLAIGSHHPPGA